MSASISAAAAMLLPCRFQPYTLPREARYADAADAACCRPPLSAPMFQRDALMLMPFSR